MNVLLGDYSGATEVLAAVGIIAILVLCLIGTATIIAGLSNIKVQANGEDSDAEGDDK